MRRSFDIVRVPAAALLVALALTATASAATPPTAITGPVTATAATTVTLSGTVNPNGTTTTWQFEYGKSTTYGSTTTGQSAGTGTANTGVSADLTGLTPGTQYHYRLVATSSAGTTDGADGIFTTSTSSPPTATTSAATNVTSNGATLNGSLNPNGQATTYDFEYGKTTSYGSTTGTQNGGSDTASVNVSAAITGLSASTTYHFRLDATSSSGTTNGPDMTFTTSATGSAAAPVVTTKAATSVTSTGAKLNGTVNPNGQATTYFFDYGTTTSYGSKTAVVSAGSGTKAVTVSATLTGLASGAVYHFRIEATSSAGTTVGSDMTFGSTGPPAVQTGTAQGASTSGATLTGTVNPEGNTTSWYFQYGTTTGYGSQTASKSAGSGNTVTGVSAVVSSLVAGTTYHYRLVATSSAGTTYGSDVTFTTVSAVTISSSTVQLVYGSQATLSGAVASRSSGVKVSVLSQPYGSSALTSVGTATTGAGGSWTLKVKPKIQTSYKASAADGLSVTVEIGVRPAVSLRLITGKRFTTRVVGSKSFQGKTVQLQRLLPGNRWQTLAKATLNSKSSAVFDSTKLPRGTSSIRIAMSVNQAGAGYLAAFSRTLTYHR
jgi:hypothetical protein